MPQLPSGRHVGIHCLPPDDIIKKVSRTYPEVSLITLGMKVKEIDSLEAIKPYVCVLFVRASSNPENNQFDERSQSIPENSEPYDSGHTLADIEEFTADWSEDDKQAFNNFLRSEIVGSYFQDVLKQMDAIGTHYQNNLLSMMEAISGDNPETSASQNKS